MLEPFLKMMLFSLPFSIGPLEMDALPSSSLRVPDGADAVARTTIRTWDGPQRTFVKQYKKGELLFSTETVLNEEHQALSTQDLVDVTTPQLHAQAYSYKDGKLDTWKAYLYGTAYCYYIGDILDSVYISGEAYDNGQLFSDQQKIKFTYDSNGNLTKKATEHPLGQLVVPDIWEYTYYLPDSVIAKMDKSWTKTYYLKNGLLIKEVDKDSSGLSLRRETTTWSYGTTSRIRANSSKLNEKLTKYFLKKDQKYRVNGTLKFLRN